MFLELRRVFSGMGGRGAWRFVFDFVLLPFFVAAIMTAAFLARSSPADHRDSFLYFGTLYAFWCGLFGSCQAFNGEVSSGEWSYWMLGMRRGVFRHYLAHFTACVASGLIQVAVSLVFLWGIWKLGAIMKPLGVLFVDPNNAHAFIYQSSSLMTGGDAYNLQGVQSVMDHFDKLNSYDDQETLPITWFLFCLKFYLLAVVTAVVSGVTLGLLVSSFCPTPQLSLTVSVLIVVSCTIFSYVGVKGTGTGEDVKEFAPVSVIADQRGSPFPTNATLRTKCNVILSQCRDGGAVEMISFVLPQRYFFNIARIPCLDLKRSLGKSVDVIDVGKRSWHNPERLLEHAQRPVGGCKCPVCIELVHITETNGLKGVVSKNSGFVPLTNTWFAAARKTWGKWKELIPEEKWNCSEAFRDAVREDYGAIQSLFRLCSRMAWTETATAVFWCFVHFLFTLTIIHKREMFRELR